MLDKLQLTAYKQAIAESYDRRSHSYDDSNWHLQICSQLLIYSQIESEQCVLDIGTGTGHLAIGAAKIVGEKGRVIGIDISTEMIKTAQRKAEALGLKNIQFQLTDAEQLNYPDRSFDHILCANTFPWLENKAATLASWYRLLKPGGGIGIHTPADTAYVGAVILKKVLTKLKGELRILVDMSYFQGFTHEEISKTLDIPLGTVKTRIRSALIQLRTMIQ